MQRSTPAMNAVWSRLASALENERFPAVDRVSRRLSMPWRSAWMTSVRSVWRSFSVPECKSATRRVRWSKTSRDVGARSATCGNPSSSERLGGSCSKKRTTSYPQAPTRPPEKGIPSILGCNSGVRSSVSRRTLSHSAAPFGLGRGSPSITSWSA